MHPCEPCLRIGNTSEGIFYCIECSETICNQCSSDHSKFRQLVEHDIVENVPFKTDVTEVNKAVTHVCKAESYQNEDNDRTSEKEVHGSGQEQAEGLQKQFKEDRLLGVEMSSDSAPEPSSEDSLYVNLRPTHPDNKGRQTGNGSRRAQIDGSARYSVIMSPTSEGDQYVYWNLKPSVNEGRRTRNCSARAQSGDSDPDSPKHPDNEGRRTRNGSTQSDDSDPDRIITCHGSQDDLYLTCSPKHPDNKERHTPTGSARAQCRMLSEPRVFLAVVLESDISGKAGIARQTGHVIVTSSYVIFASIQSCLSINISCIRNFSVPPEKAKLFKIEVGRRFQHGPGILEFSTTPANALALFHLCCETASRKASSMRAKMSTIA